MRRAPLRSWFGLAISATTAGLLGQAAATPRGDEATTAETTAEATATETASASFGEAMQRAAAAPALQAGGDAARTWRRDAERAARWRPDWALSVAPGGSVGGASGTSGGRWQAELHAALVPGRDAAARAAARAGADALEAATASERRERRRRLAEAWLGAWSAQRRLGLATEEEGAAAELLALARRARALGAATLVEEAAAEAYLAETELARLTVEGEVTEGGLRLAEAMGDDRGRPVAARGEPPELSFDGAAAAPAAAAARAQAREAAERAAEHAAAARPGVQLGLRAESDGQERAAFVVLGIALPGGSPGRLARSAALAEKHQLEGRAEELDAAARLEQARARHEVEHAGELRRATSARAAALDRQRAATDAAQRAGEALLPELVLARRALAAARADEINAQAMEALARVERALAAGWGEP